MKKWFGLLIILLLFAVGLWALPSPPCNGLVWNASAGATKYKAYWRTDPTVAYSDVNSKDVGNVTAILFAAVLPAIDTATATTKHYFVVTALDASSESQFSNEVSCKKQVGNPTGLVTQ